MTIGALLSRAEAVHGTWTGAQAGAGPGLLNSATADAILVQTEALIADVMAITGDEARQLEATLRQRHTSYRESLAGRPTSSDPHVTAEIARVVFEAGRAATEYDRHFAGRSHKAADLVRLRAIEERLARACAALEGASPDRASARVELSRRLAEAERVAKEVTAAWTALKPVERPDALRARGDAIIAQYVTHFAHQGFATGSAERFERVLAALSQLLAEMRAPGPVPVPAHRVKWIADNLEHFARFRGMAALGQSVPVRARLAALGARSDELMHEYRTHVAGRPPTVTLRDSLTPICDRMADLSEQMWTCVAAEPDDAAREQLATTLARLREVEQAWQAIEQVLRRPPQEPSPTPQDVKKKRRGR